MKKTNLKRKEIKRTIKQLNKRLDKIQPSKHVDYYMEDLIAFIILITLLYYLIRGY